MGYGGINVPGLDKFDFIDASVLDALQSTDFLPVIGENNLYKAPVDLFGGKKTVTYVVGTSTAGHTLMDCDYLCDGTDDQVEINAALKAAPFGGEVLLLNGVYNITQRIKMWSNSITLRGCGETEIFLSGTSENYAIYIDYDEEKQEYPGRINGDTYRSHSAIIKNLRLRLDRYPRDSVCAIYDASNYGHELDLYDVNTQGFGKSLYNFRTGSNNSAITDIRIERCFIDRIDLKCSHAGAFITNNRITDAMLVKNSQSNSYRRFVVQHNMVNSNIDLKANGFLISDNYVGGCLYLESIPDDIENVYSGMLYGTNISNNCAVDIRAAYLTHAVISGNTCCGVGVGIQLNYAKWSEIIGNICWTIPDSTGIAPPAITLSGENNLIASNILSSNYLNEGGTGNMFINNKVKEA